MNNYDIGYLHVLQLQIMYMARPYCKVRDRFVISIRDNLKRAGIPDNNDLWYEIMARVIKSCSLSSSKRVELLFPILDAIDVLLEASDDRAHPHV
jgi:hypothetical protein